VLGTLGTCPPVTPKDAAAEDGAGGSAADAGKEGGSGKGGAAGHTDGGVDGGARAADVGSTDDGGCGCRTSGAPATGWVALMLGLGGFAARRSRRSKRASSSP
jgi:MYXO-CTERM domain-containing protein